VRPTWIFGGDRDVLTNNIAWILRRMPLFAIPGNGRYLVQPVHADDVARNCIEQSKAADDVLFDAAGPETMSFEQVVPLDPGRRRQPRVDRARSASGDDSRLACSRSARTRHRSD
jgi:nucleoside-diphosphate-sugar epimerase